LEKPTMDYRTVVSTTLDDMWHVPFAREYLQTLLRLLPVTRRRKVIAEEDYKMHVARRHAQSDEIWLFLECRYGLTRTDHMEFLELLARVERLPVVIQTPWMHHVLSVDS